MGIWTYAKFFKQTVPLSDQLTLGEGLTPLEKVTFKEFNRLEVSIKHEEKNPTGSFKDRYMALLVSYLKTKNESRFCLSSSGNAAISALSYCSLFPSSLDLFLSKSIYEKKLERLKARSEGLCKLTLHFSLQPKRELFRFKKETSAVDLRATQSDLPIEGYKTIAYELKDDNFDSIFIPTSSAVGALGIAQGFRELGKQCPAFYLIQTSKIHPIAKEFDREHKVSKTSLASAISDRVCVNKSNAIELITKSKGSSYSISATCLLRSCPSAR